MSPIAITLFASAAIAFPVAYVIVKHTARSEKTTAQPQDRLEWLIAQEKKLMDRLVDDDLGVAELLSFDRQMRYLERQITREYELRAAKKKGDYVEV